MNIITSQIQQQKPEILEMICQIHKREIVAVDLDTSEEGQLQYICCNCLVEKMNNNKISTIEQTQERIKSLKTQKYENKTRDIQSRLDYFKRILDQIMEFKCNVENTLEKIYSQIKAQIFTIQKEKQSLLENCQVLHNFQEDVKLLSEFLSTNSQFTQMELQQDSQFIDEIFKQFELLFNNASYFQTIDIFKDAKQKINEINENIKTELLPLQNKNNQKTPSLKKVCPTHNREIIMIDIDTKNKKMEDRFVCVDCIDDHPNCQYRTIEKVNQEWNHSKNQQDKILNDLKLKRLEKQEKLNQQIALMRKNYNQQLNEISEKLITEFSQPINKTVEPSKFKQTSIYGLSHEELVSNISYLIQYDKENLGQDSKIEYVKSKDALFSKEIESRLEHLKQHDQLDIQESINILQDIQNDNQIQGIVLLSQQLQENTKVNQEQLIVKQDFDELIISSKELYCQVGLFNQTIYKFQQHLNKINNISNKFKSIPDHLNLTNLNKQVQDYTDKFEKDFKQLKKFCEIEKLENKLETLQQDYQKLVQEKNQIMDSIENDYKNKIKDMNVIIDKLKEIETDTIIKLKQSEDENQLLNKKLKEEQNNYTQKLNELQIKTQQQIQELNNKISLQDILNLQLTQYVQKKLQKIKNNFFDQCKLIIYFFQHFYQKATKYQKKLRSFQSFRSLSKYLQSDHFNFQRLFIL